MAWIGAVGSGLIHWGDQSRGQADQSAGTGLTAGSIQGGTFRDVERLGWASEWGVSICVRGRGGPSARCADRLKPL
eukprot:3596010-Prymnesium_polylepis.1